MHNCAAKRLHLVLNSMSCLSTELYVLDYAIEREQLMVIGSLEWGLWTSTKRLPLGRWEYFLPMAHSHVCPQELH